MTDGNVESPGNLGPRFSFSSVRLARGLASNVFAQAVSLLQSVLLLPLFLRAWGAPLYGRWVVISSLVTYLSLLDLGGAGFIGNAMAAAYARGDEEEFESLFERGFSLYLLLAAASATVVAFVFIWLPYWSWTLTERWAALVLALGLLQTIPAGLLASLWRATGHFPQGNLVGNGCRAVSLVGFAVALILKIGIIGFAIVTLAGGLLTSAVGTAHILTIVPALGRYRFSFTSAKLGLPLLGRSLWFWLFSVAQGLNVQGLLLVVAAFLPSTAAAQFSTHRTLVGFVGIGTAILLPAISTEFTFLLAQGERDRGAFILEKVMRASSVCGVSIAVCLWLFAPLLYTWWTGKHLAFAPGLLLVLMLQATLAAAWNTASWPLLATNQHQGLAICAFANGLLTCLLAAAVLRFVPSLVWAAAASLVGDVLLGLLIYPVLAAKSLGVPASHFFGAMLRGWAATLPLSVAAWFCRRHNPNLRDTVLLSILMAPLFIASIEWGVGRGTLRTIGRAMASRLSLARLRT